LSKVIIIYIITVFFNLILRQLIEIQLLIIHIILIILLKKLNNDFLKKLDLNTLILTI